MWSLRFLALASLCCCAAACTAPAPTDGPSGSADQGQGPDLAPPGDLAQPDDSQSWPQYVIEVGGHSARIEQGQPGNPVAALVTLTGRDYQLRFNTSSMYVIDKPVEPNDQLDWNKLPGFSDCGTVDLSVNGAMFGWRWRLDTMPRVLEVTAYANNQSKHLWPALPLFTLTAEDLAAEAPLRYRVWEDGTVYRFAVTGQVRGRVISVATTLPRACPTYSGGGLQWASGLYFGGTSPAPSMVTGRIWEGRFAP